MSETTPTPPDERLETAARSRVGGVRVELFEGLRAGSPRAADRRRILRVAQSRAARTNPQPFLFQVDGGKPFAFAALWTPAKIAGEWLHSLVMLTCDAAPNRLAAQIHDRMPVILADRDSQRAWLDPDVDAEPALELCHAIDEHRLSTTPANPALNKIDHPRDQTCSARQPSLNDPRAERP